MGRLHKELIARNVIMAGYYHSTFFLSPPPPPNFPRHFQCGGRGVGGGGGGAYSITVVCLYVRPVPNTNGFRAISFEKIGVLD